jgi:hypothetical protein
VLAQMLKDFLGLEKIIWLWRGMEGDTEVVNGAPAQSSAHEACLHVCDPSSMRACMRRHRQHAPML